MKVNSEMKREVVADPGHCMAGHFSSVVGDSQSSLIVKDAKRNAGNER
jgi:hypothetical protein